MVGGGDGENNKILIFSDYCEWCDDWPRKLSP